MRAPRIQTGSKAMSNLLASMLCSHPSNAKLSPATPMLAPALTQTPELARERQSTASWGVPCDSRAKFALIWAVMFYRLAQNLSFCFPIGLLRNLCGCLGRQLLNGSSAMRASFRYKCPALTGLHPHALPDHTAAHRAFDMSNSNRLLATL